MKLFLLNELEDSEIERLREPSLDNIKVPSGDFWQDRVESSIARIETLVSLIAEKLNIENPFNKMINN